VSSTKGWNLGIRSAQNAIESVASRRCSSIGRFDEYAVSSANSGGRIAEPRSFSGA
jgi:hypothetical protein